MAYYFASDAHMGMPVDGDARLAERRLVEWLASVGPGAEGIFLNGDIFDFWYEYKQVVPRGFTRFFGAVAALADRGVPVHFLVGNHDLWTFGYLERELGVTVHKTPYITELYGHRLFIAHGHGLGEAFKYRFLQSCFRSKALQWMFSHLLHPDFAVRLAHRWSRSRRKAEPDQHTDGQLRAVKFASDYLKKDRIDCFVLGHYHCPAEHDLGGGSRLFVLGGWFREPVYGVLDEGGFRLVRF